MDSTRLTIACKRIADGSLNAAISGEANALVHRWAVLNATQPSSAMEDRSIRSQKFTLALQMEEFVLSHY
jgi:hypothetical protein